MAEGFWLNHLLVTEVYLCSGFHLLLAVRRQGDFGRSSMLLLQRPFGFPVADEKDLGSHVAIVPGNTVRWIVDL